MAVFEWGKCGKATLLHKCGEMLFGCSGKMLVTQGIYVPKLVSSQPFYLLCKRTVWVPDSLSYECLFEHLLSFGAMLPFSVKKIASLHRFGLCGINPTRTIYAIDKCFLLLAKYPRKHFSVYGVIEIGMTDPSSVLFIESILTSKGEILSHVECIKSEINLYQQSKESKSQRTSPDELEGDTNDQVREFIEAESGPVHIEGEQESPIQQSVTECDISTNTPQSLFFAPYESMSPLNVCFNGDDLPNPSPILLDHSFPSPSIIDESCDQDPFFQTP